MKTKKINNIEMEIYDSFSTFMVIKKFGKKYSELSRRKKRKCRDFLKKLKEKTSEFEIAVSMNV